jgi:hypothetical protein
LGYRLSLLLGGVALTLAQLWVYLQSDFWGFTFLFAGIALARSLISGAGSAYLFELLKAEGDGVYAEVEGRARFWSLIGKAFLWGWVGVLVEIDALLPFGISAGFSVLSVIAAWKLPEITPESQSPRLSFFRGMRELGTLLKSPTPERSLYLGSMIQGVLIFVAARLIQLNLFQLLLDSVGLAVRWNGWVMGAMTLMESYAGTISRKQVGSEFWSLRRQVSRLTGFMSLALLGFCSIWWMPEGSWVRVGAGLLSFLGFSWVVGRTYPIQRLLMNLSITKLTRGEGTYRASLLSLESIMDRGSNAFVAWGLTLVLGASVRVELGVPTWVLGIGGYALLSGVLAAWVLKKP